MVIANEKAKLKKKKSRKTKKQEVMDTDSNSNNSIAVIENAPFIKKRKLNKNYERIDEESAFLKFINTAKYSDKIPEQD